jgi:phosphatidylserine synthase
LASGLAAAAAFAVGGAPWLYLGASLFAVSAVLDRADGELARLSGKTSRGGHTYDIASDGIANAFLFFGIGIGLRDSVLGQWSILMGVVAGIAVAATLLMVIRIEALKGPRAAELPSAGGFDADDVILLVPVAIVAGLEVPMLVAAAVIAPIFTGAFLWHYRWCLAGLESAPTTWLACLSRLHGVPGATAPASTGNTWSRRPRPPRRKEEGSPAT